VRKKRKTVDASSDCILREAAVRFGTTKGKLTKLHHSQIIDEGETIIEKSLYQYERDGKGFTLRLTIPQYVDFGLIPGEVDWINYLADCGLCVPRAIPSENGSLVEIIETEDSSFAAVSFEKAEGRCIDFENSDEWNAKLFERYGRTIGKMHAFTKSYRPVEESLTRMEWHQQDWFANIDRYLPSSESLIRRKYLDLMESLHDLPQDENSFGLIHGDAHPWNLLVHEEKIILTDFDFCERNWFVFDIAIALFYALMAPIEGMDRIAFTRHFLENFMNGYNKEYGLDACWMKQIPGFLRSRMISKYILHYREWKSGRMKENRRRAFMEWKHKIENDIPYVDVEFSNFG
jgi:Ser/Thr protein kinase RdoA (MazF antagonist)